MRAKDENKNAKKGSEKDKIDEEWNNFFEEDETDWCTLQKPKVDIVKNKIHGNKLVLVFVLNILLFRETR